MIMNKQHEDRGYAVLKVLSKKSSGFPGWKKQIRQKGSTALLWMLGMVQSIGSNGKGYENVDDGDKVAIAWKDQGLNLCCCDCGLVHYISFEVIDHTIILTFWRNEEETAKARKVEDLTYDLEDADE